MARLENVSVEELEAALDAADGKRETKRLLVAIIYKRGPSAPMIAEWLDTREQTIYRWFDRLETEPIEQAVKDRQRPGRPPKLDDEFDVEYSRRHVQRLLQDAGLTWQTPRPQPPTADEDERTEFWESTKKTG